MNKIYTDDIFANVIDWVCNIDGYDGAIGGILCNLPYPFDGIEDYKMRDRYNEEMDKIIGNRPEINVHKILMGDFVELEKLHEFAKELSCKIVKKHNELVEIAEANRFTGRIQSIIRVVNGIAEYKIVQVFHGKTKYDVITKMIEWIRYTKNPKPLEWLKYTTKNNGWIYDSLYKGMTVSVFNYYMTMDNRVINS